MHECTVCADYISLQQGTAKLGVKVCQCGSNGPAFFHILSVHSIIGRGVAEAFKPITAQCYPVALVACGLSSLHREASDSIVFK